MPFLFSNAFALKSGGAAPPPPPPPPGFAYHTHFHQTGNGPYDINALDVGAPYTGKHLIISAQSWQSATLSSPTMSFSINGGSALTPVASLNANRNVAHMFIVPYDSLSTIDIDITISLVMLGLIVSIHSSEEVSCTDSLPTQDNLNTHNYVRDIADGEFIIGTAASRSGGTGFVGIGSELPTPQLGYATSAVRTTTALTWNGLTERAEGSAGAASNFMASLFARFTPVP